MMFSREQILSLIESNNELVQTANDAKKHAEKTGDRWLAEECDKIIINHQKEGTRWLEKLAEHDREIESDK